MHVYTHHASDTPIRLSLVVGFAGLDVPVEPAGVGVLPGRLTAVLILWVCEYRQVLRMLAHENVNICKRIKHPVQYTCPNV